MDKKFIHIEKTVSDLLSILKEYNNGHVSNLITKLEDLLYIIRSNDDKDTKEIKSTTIIEALYPIRGGLTDFYVWKEDAKERIEINKPISELSDKLWNLVKNDIE